MLANVSFVYCSKFSAQDCIKSLMQPPLHFKISWMFSRDYEIERLSNSELIITFTKGYNLSSHRTKYRVTLNEQSGSTIIILNFVDEQGLALFPFVTDWEITKFLKNRIGAIQIKEHTETAKAKPAVPEDNPPNS